MLKQILALRAQLLLLFPERAAIVDGALAAILAQEHVLLVGPPGTAKTALVSQLATAFSGKTFTRLMTRFTTPDEIFGPLSITALQQDRYQRVTTDMLSEANFVLLDEVYKSSSAILNTLLTILNERTFNNGSGPVVTEIVTVFGASNELPEGKELEALHDRFLLRYSVDYLLRPQNLRNVLAAPEPKLTSTLDMKTLRAAQADVAKVKVTDATVDALIAIRDTCRAEGIVASDRRLKKSLRVVQAAAWMGGERETAPEDLTLLTDALWREPKERSKIAKLVGRLADPTATQATEILDAAKETADKVIALRSGDRKAYIAHAAQALEAFVQQTNKLEKLGKSAGRRAKDTIDSASAEIAEMHAELARAVSSGLGLRRAEK